MLRVSLRAFGAPVAVSGRFGCRAASSGGLPSWATIDPKTWSGSDPFTVSNLGACGGGYMCVWKVMLECFGA